MQYGSQPTNRRPQEGGSCSHPTQPPAKTFSGPSWACGEAGEAFPNGATPIFLINRTEGGAAATAAGGGLALPWGLGRQPAAGELPAGSGPEAEGDLSTESTYPQVARAS